MKLVQGTRKGILFDTERAHKLTPGGFPVKSYCKLVSAVKE